MLCSRRIKKQCATSVLNFHVTADIHRSVVSRLQAPTSKLCFGHHKSNSQLYGSENAVSRLTLVIETRDLSYENRPWLDLEKCKQQRFSCAMSVLKLAKGESICFFVYFVLQIKQAGFYDNIMKTVRGEPEYFKVAFYGLGFPTFLRVSLKLFYMHRFRASPLNNINGAKNEEATKQGLCMNCLC